MRIGIDACCWSNRRGFGRFTRELVAHMVAGFPGHEFVLFMDRRTAQDYQFPAGACIQVVDTRRQPTRAAAADSARSPADLWRMSRAVSRQALDVFFFPAVYSFYPLLRRIPTVVTFHDAIPESQPELIFPGLRSRVFWKLKVRLALRQADQILTVSQNARSQIAKAFHYPESAIHVIEEGPNACFQPTNDPETIRCVLRQYHLPSEAALILYVGGISPHKNLQGLLQALARVRQESPGPWHLVLVGDHTNDSFYGCYEELVALCGQLKMTERVTFTGFVPDEHLVALYNAATMLVLPSFNEGFGLPVVEAMACGVPVAASRRGSLPEVVGSAGVLFDPGDHEEMASVLVRLLDDSALRQHLRAEGLRRAENFSWKAGAAKAVHLFEEMAYAAAQTA
jgi:glycosyltransferase involved in cell wall biosynthesis